MKACARALAGAGARPAAGRKAAATRFWGSIASRSRGNNSPALPATDVALRVGGRPDTSDWRARGAPVAAAGNRALPGQAAPRPAPSGGDSPRIGDRRDPPLHDWLPGLAAQ